MMLLCSSTFWHLSAHANEITTDAWDVSGHVDVVSKYISRGLSNAPENDNFAIQAGLNLSYGQFYLGYWGSTLGYSYPELQGRKKHRADQFEHDFIVGLSKQWAGYDWDLWDATYYYPGGKKSTSNEFGFSVSRTLADTTTLAFGASTYLYDVVYANQGDTFYHVSLSQQFNTRLSANLTAAASYFNDDGKYEGKDLGDTETTHTFRYASTGLTYNLLPQLSLSADYFFGGKDRYAERQRDRAIFGLSYTFF